MQPFIQAFFHEPTNTVSYLVGDPVSHDAAVIDPVLDFDLHGGAARTDAADEILRFADSNGWTIRMVLETHAHADHLSAAPLIKAKTGAWIGIGEHIRDVQRIFRAVFAMDDLTPDGSDFDRLLADGETIALGSLKIHAMHVPGHTAADLAYRIGDAVFVGDTLFMPDYGTARTDFPGGDARTLYRSIQRILSLPAEMRLFMCHDYKSPTRDTYAWQSTVAEQKRDNVHIGGAVSEDEFVAMRQQRDASLRAPKLLQPSIQVNIKAGYWPAANSNGVSYLKVPLKLNGAPAAPALMLAD